jgi:tetratricopeptide (TPR) repeat protein
MIKKILTVAILLFGVFGLSGCLENFQEEKKIEKKLLTGTADESNHKKAETYFQEANYSEALKYDLKQLEEDLLYYREKSAEIALDYNDIGLDYAKLKKYKKALEYYTKAMNIDNVVLTATSIEKATTYYNIATSYQSLKDYPNALLYYNKALEIDQDKENIIASYQEIGMVHEKTKLYRLSFDFYKKALELQEKLYNKDDERIFTTKEKLRELGKLLK